MAPLDWTGALLRNLLRAADFSPLFNVLGLLTMLVLPKPQRLGDIAAGTLVVYRRKDLVLEHIPAQAPVPRPQRLTLAPAEQRLILAITVPAGPSYHPSAPPSWPLAAHADQREPA